MSSSTSTAGEAVSHPQVQDDQREPGASTFESTDGAEVVEGDDRRHQGEGSTGPCAMPLPSAPTEVPSAEAQACQVAATVTLAVLLERLEKMLMAGAGAPAALGMLLVATGLSGALVYYVDKAANVLFDKRGLEAVQKSAGVVDREEARAYMLLDALGEPLLPCKRISSSGRELGRQLGESVRQAAARQEKKVKAAVKAAGRVKGGPSKEAVTAEALQSHPVQLELLPECIAAARAPPPRQPRPPTPEPPEPPEPPSFAERWLQHRGLTFEILQT